MNKNLTNKDIELAIKLLETWDGALTWVRFLSAFRETTKKKISKQGIHKSHPNIVKAFNVAKDRHRENRQMQRALTGKFPTGDAYNTVLSRKIAGLTEELNRVKREKEQLIEQFMRWQNNAHAHGLTLEMLNQPMPSAKSGKDSTLKRK